MNRCIRPITLVLIALAAIVFAATPAQAQPGSRSRFNVTATLATINANDRGATSTDTVGTANTYAIQSSLDAANAKGGGVVYIGVPGIYVVNDSIKATAGTINATLNAALVIYSNTTLMLADGVTIKLANGCNVYTLRNASGGHASNRDSNISIIGGKWDFNGDNQNVDSRDGAGKIYWKFHGIWFDQVDGLTCDGVEMIGGKKFCVWHTRSTRGRVSNLYIHSTGSDGWHIGGGCSDIVIRDSRFVGCPDNATPIITNEGGYYPTVGGAEAQYLDAPHGPTRQVAFLNNEYPGCEIAPIRLAGGDGNIGTDNIEDVLIDGCTGSTESGSAVEVIDDTTVSPNITGALVRNLTVRNCRFVATNDASGYANGFMVYVNATGMRELKMEGCVNTDLGFSLTGATSGGGANATAFIDGEVVTESGTSATGYYRNEAGGKIHVYPRTGTFTGASTPTYTGATSGAIRYNSTSTAPAELGQNMLYVGARCTAVESIVVANCVDKKAYAGTIYVVASAVVNNIAVTGGSYTLGIGGRVLQIAGTVPSYAISGASITGPATSSANSVVRIDSTAGASHGSITGNSIKAVQYLIDNNHATGVVFNFNLSGLMLTGYGAAQASIINNRNTTSQSIIGGHGNVYTDFATGWYAHGMISQPTSTGYVRVNNPTLRFRGEWAATNMAAGWAYDVFWNTSTTASGGPPTWATMGVGPVQHDGTVYQKYAR